MYDRERELTGVHDYQKVNFVIVPIKCCCYHRLGYTSTINNADGEGKRSKSVFFLSSSISLAQGQWEGYVLSHGIISTFNCGSHWRYLHVFHYSCFFFISACPLLSLSLSLDLVLVYFTRIGLVSFIDAALLSAQPLEHTSVYIAGWQIEEKKRKENEKGEEKNRTTLSPASVLNGRCLSSFADFFFLCLLLFSLSTMIGHWWE